MKCFHPYRMGWLLALCPLFCQGQNRWSVNPTLHCIEWNASNGQPLDDHIEMSGEQVSAILRYGMCSDSSWRMDRTLVWPMLRTLPNDTHASLIRHFATDYLSEVTVEGRLLGGEQVRRVTSKGDLTVYSRLTAGGDLTVDAVRRYCPSTTLPMLCEAYTIINTSSRIVNVCLPKQRTVSQTDPARGVEGSYTLVCSTTDDGQHTLEPKQSCTFYVYIEGLHPAQRELIPDMAAEFKAREAFIEQMQRQLVFESPDTTLNMAFFYAKIRAAESIFRTKGGYMHCPGGGAYYAAIWANDQAEYANPLFPYLGYATANEAALNSYLLFARYMNPEYKPLPSSIIAEGLDTWAGAGDRGDAAMIAYGASRYILARSDRKEAEQLWPLIQWCLQYCYRHLTPDGVVASDCDELEHRFPADKANLCTSSLYYDALISAAQIAPLMGCPSYVTGDYRTQATRLREAIDRYFGARIEGFDTYRYYDGNDCLRSWICIPLVMGIFDRSDETIRALFSPQLWTENGLLSASGSTTFWDRSTLYALRGVFAAGERRKGLEHLHAYSTRRLLGDHVPYPIEAWPEGGQRHLSAESALYCRIITEGLFGIRPTGFGTFNLTPQLPDGWNSMALRNIGAFGNRPFDLVVTRRHGRLDVTIERDGQIVKKLHCKTGGTIACEL